MPTVHETLLTAMSGDLHKMINKPVLIVSWDIRRSVKQFIEQEFTSLPVLLIRSSFRR